MAGSKKIFIDTSYLYAFIDRADPNHVTAVKSLEQFSLQGTILYSGVLTVNETFNALSRQLGTTIGYDFLQAMTESDIEILYPQKADFVTASRVIKLNRDKQISFKEAITAVLMQKRGINQILTFTYWHNLLGSQPYLLPRF